MTEFISLGQAVHDPILTLIVGCEIGFWVLVFGGLAARYILRLPRVSTVMLAAIPLLDLVLLVAVAIDIADGGHIGTAHRLVGIYVGWTLMFERSTVRALDIRFAHRFAGGPPPPKRPKSGPVAFQHELRAWLKWLCAAVIALIITYGLSWTVADESQAVELRSALYPIAIITVGWFVFGPLWVRSRSNKEHSGDRQ